MKYLIVMADDFGLAESINDGIVKAYKEGIVTDLNFLPSGEAFEHAVGLAKGLGIEDVGAHLSLTETAPVSAPRNVPTLVTGSGRFHKDRSALFLAHFTWRLDRNEVYTELKAQLDLLKSRGLKISVLSSHEHIHMMPFMFDIFIDLAREYEIPFLRYIRGDKLISPVNIKKFLKYLILVFFEMGSRKIIDKKKINCSDSLRGFIDSGDINEESLLKILNSLGDGIVELVCHPGLLSPRVLDKYKFHINCERELAALMSRRARRFIAESAIVTARYGSLIRTGAGH